MAVLDWLLDSDPAIRWQVMRALDDAPAAGVAAARARVATEGWGARLLALRRTRMPAGSILRSRTATAGPAAGTR